MKIEKNVIKFKSDAYFYSLEKQDVKLCTVRILDFLEVDKLKRWRMKQVIKERTEPLIEISRISDYESFTRTLTWFGDIGKLLGKEIWMFCWKQEQAKDVSENEVK